MVSGINPIRRFPAVSRHYSPTVARRLVRAPDERIRVDPSAAARGDPPPRGGPLPKTLPAPAEIRRSGSGPRTSRRSGQWNLRIPPLSFTFSTFDRRRCEGHHGQLFRTVHNCYFLMRVPGDASAIPCPPGGTRRTLFGAPGGDRIAAFSGPAPVSGGSSWCQRLSLRGCHLVIVPHVLRAVRLVNHRYNYKSTTIAKSSRRYADKIHVPV